jgi:ubiquinol-cytochrome c reductase cytochrome b subunit
MVKKLCDWFDHRTGYRKLISALLIEHIPGGAKWRYVWGSCLAFVFGIQLITGVLLMTAYSPSDSTAWASVYFIQYQMDFGWLIRGLHHFGSQTMVVLLGVHMLQVVIAGAHLPPREINWWLGLALLGAVLVLSLTGYLLPWDQKGFWATQVATNIAGNLPVAGAWLQKIIVGGPAYGHHTLTRFYALHVGIMPALIIALIIAHVAVFRRHGVTTSIKDEEGRLKDEKAQHQGADTKELVSHPSSLILHLSSSDVWFWPDQAFKDMVASMAIFAVMLALVIYGFGHKIDTPSEGRSFYDRLAHAGHDGRGANLDAPADPSRPYPARPEWYFLSLFQLLKYFEGKQEIIGTVVIPNGILVLLALLPLLGYGRMRKFGHAFGVLVVVILMGGVATLTGLAIAQDRASTEAANTFRKELVTAEALAHQSIQLAGAGIPAEGPVLLLRRDPLIKGKELFGQHCATCHTYGNDFENKKPSASNLEDFGTQQWIQGLLQNPASPEYFGHTKLRGMNNWVVSTRSKARKDGKETELEKEFDEIAAWLTSHPRSRESQPQSGGREPPESHIHVFGGAITPSGMRAFQKRCQRCHSFDNEGGDSTPRGPDFTGYGDAGWVRLMLLSPSHNLRYAFRNRMPAFRDLDGPMADINQQELKDIRDQIRKGVGEDAPEADKKKLEQDIAEATKTIQLSDIDRELIIRFLLKDYRVVFGGEPISGPPK